MNLDDVTVQAMKLMGFSNAAVAENYDTYRFYVMRLVASRLDILDCVSKSMDDRERHLVGQLSHVLRRVRCIP